QQLAVVAILAIFRRIDEIAIFTVARSGRVWAVFIAHLSQVRLWHGHAEFAKLLEKRSREVKFLRIFHRIPMIAEPVWNFIDFIRFIGRVERNDVFFAEVAFAFIEFLLIAKSGAPLQTTIGALSRCRYADLGVEVRL